MNVDYASLAGDVATGLFRESLKGELVAGFRRIRFHERDGSLVPFGGDPKRVGEPRARSGLNEPFGRPRIARLPGTRATCAPGK